MMALNPQEQFVHELQRSQWLTADEIARIQKPLLERLLRHAAMQTEFYRERLAPLFGGTDPASAPVDLARWSEVPVLRRQDAFEHVEAMTARILPPESGNTRKGESSGTTGRPLPHVRSAYDLTAGKCLLQRIYELYDVDLSGSLAEITFDKKGKLRYPDGGHFKQWNYSFPDADLFGLDICATVDEQLEWLQRTRPDHVMTYPETLREIAEAAKSKGARLEFRTFLSTGETLTAEARTTIAQTIGCRVVDIYAAREIGPIAFHCPDSEGYHACAEAMIFELLDETDRPVTSGGYGRVVVTPLYNYAMPFIRYDLGDYALASTEQCSCGRGLPWVKEVAGRTRNMFVMPDGSKRRWRGVIMRRMPEFLSYRQIQFVQTDLNTIEVRYVPDGQGAAPKCAALAEFLRQEFHGELEIRSLAVDHIERGAGMKIEQFISLAAR